MRKSTEIFRVTQSSLDEYGAIPISFGVHSILEIQGESDNSKGFILTERKLDAPYIKNYDEINGEGPKNWTKRFDVSNWGIFLARLEDKPVGGAVVALKTLNLDLLEQRSDLAVLWDIRVSPRVRGYGIGSALFKAAEYWAEQAGCLEIKIETQNINLPACKFYAKQGCTLKQVNWSVYEKYPNEIQFLWYKEIGSNEFKI
jgi:GNAT superfamily N-acetyltransferase